MCDHSVLFAKNAFSLAQTGADMVGLWMVSSILEDTPTLRIKHDWLMLYKVLGVTATDPARFLLVHANARKESLTDDPTKKFVFTPSELAKMADIMQFNAPGEEPQILARKKLLVSDVDEQVTSSLRRLTNGSDSATLRVVIR